MHATVDLDRTCRKPWPVVAAVVLVDQRPDSRCPPRKPLRKEVGMRARALSLLCIVVLSGSACSKRTAMEKGCDRADPDPKARSDLGVVYATGWGVVKDAANAASLIQRACRGGQAEACTVLGKP